MLRDARLLAARRPVRRGAGRGPAGAGRRAGVPAGRGEVLHRRRARRRRAARRPVRRPGAARSRHVAVLRLPRPARRAGGGAAGQRAVVPPAPVADDVRRDAAVEAVVGAELEPARRRRPTWARSARSCSRRSARRRSRSPLLRLPADDLCYAFNLVRLPATGDAAAAERLVAANRAAYERVRAAGGTLYPVSALPAVPRRLARPLRPGLRPAGRREADVRPGRRPHARATRSSSYFARILALRRFGTAGTVARNLGRRSFRRRSAGGCFAARPTAPIAGAAPRRTRPAR